MPMMWFRYHIHPSGASSARRIEVYSVSVDRKNKNMYSMYEWKLVVDFRLMYAGSAVCGLILVAIELVIAQELS